MNAAQYVLARVFGASGDLFDREEEQQIFGAVAHAGLGPKLLVSTIMIKILIDTSFTITGISNFFGNTCKQVLRASYRWAICFRQIQMRLENTLIKICVYMGNPAIGA